MKTKSLFIFILVVWIIANIFLFVHAQGQLQNSDLTEVNDLEIYGLEIEKLLSFINGVLALVLFIITFLAFKKDKRKRLFYVSIAFLLYSVRSFFAASELFIGEIFLLDTIAVLLDFVILLTFFFGLLKK